MAGGPADQDLAEIRKLIGHDLRSPLAIVLGQCEVLGLEVWGPLTDRQRDALRSIEAQVERMLALVDEAHARLRAAAPPSGSGPTAPDAS